ncbi:MAG TPA: NADP-dependent oxidoreductase [Candidatus Polarisedimenticolaceae bacterium]|nr:NADP-dependent oxidoreductase [Candidatus Polarisedimenticolaceae bacterium]
MRAMAIDAFGGPERLRPGDRPRPKPRAHELLIRTVAAGVNPVDARIVGGRLPSGSSHAFPLIPGFDVAGVVDELGERTSRLRKGDRVWALALAASLQWGSYAEFVAVDESSVALMPTKLLYEEAAAVPLAALAARQALFDEGRLATGGSVLIHSGSGGVGHFAVQLAKSAGCRVLATGGPANQGFLAEIGADVPIDHTRVDLRDAVGREVPGGVDLVLQTVDPANLTRSLDLVRPGGRLVSTVGLPGGVPRTGAAIRQLSVKPSADGLRSLAALVDRGALRPHVSAILSLEQAPEALRRIAAGHVRGKLVLNL